MLRVAPHRPARFPPSYHPAREKLPASVFTPDHRFAAANDHTAYLNFLRDEVDDRGHPFASNSIILKLEFDSVPSRQTDPQTEPAAPAPGLSAYDSLRRVLETPIILIMPPDQNSGLTSQFQHTKH